MPIPKEPYDFEYAYHNPHVPGFGTHHENDCDVQSEERHEHDMRWTCTRERGHMGRHEAGIYEHDDEGRPLIIASWAHKP